jgi:uncharacterized membrane protein (DUF106 family)
MRESMWFLSFASHYALQFHPLSCKWNHFILLWGWIIRCVHISHVLYPVICWWASRLIPYLGYYE